MQQQQQQKGQSLERFFRPSAPNGTLTLRRNRLVGGRRVRLDEEEQGEGGRSNPYKSTMQQGLRLDWQSDKEKAETVPCFPHSPPSIWPRPTGWGSAVGGFLFYTAGEDVGACVSAVGGRK